MECLTWQKPQFRRSLSHPQQTPSTTFLTCLVSLVEILKSESLSTSLCNFMHGIGSEREYCKSVAGFQKRKRTHLFRLLCSIMQHCYRISVATFSYSCALWSSTGIRKTFMLNPDAKIGHLSDSMLPGKMLFFLLRHLMT